MTSVVPHGRGCGGGGRRRYVCRGRRVAGWRLGAEVCLLEVGGAAGGRAGGGDGRRHLLCDMREDGLGGDDFGTAIGTAIGWLVACAAGGRASFLLLGLGWRLRDMGEEDI